MLNYTTLLTKVDTNGRQNKPAIATGEADRYAIKLFVNSILVDLKRILLRINFFYEQLNQFQYGAFLFDCLISKAPEIIWEEEAH